MRSRRSPVCSARRPALRCASPDGPDPVRAPRPVQTAELLAPMTFPVTSMISVEEARARILAFFERLPVVRPPLLDALGQVLAEAVVAPFDIPPLDNTAMDGYAVRAV